MPWIRPKIFGVLNITADSFSDGGRWLEPDAALAHAHALVEAGADVVDLGAIASNPDAIPVPVTEELNRLDPIITALHARGAAVSIDSFRPETQLYAISRGVAYLNDIHGFPHSHIYPDLAQATCRLVLMHSVHGPAQISRADIAVGDVVETILRFFEARVKALTAGGIERGRLILDPGMGYFLGANPVTSFAALAGVQRLRGAFGLPILIGVSRKSFLRSVAGHEHVGTATLAAEIYAALEGVEFIRTHDVAALQAALRVVEGIKSASAPNR